MLYREYLKGTTDKKSTIVLQVANITHLLFQLVHKDREFYIKEFKIIQLGNYQGADERKLSNRLKRHLQPIEKKSPNGTTVRKLKTQKSTIAIENINSLAKKEKANAQAQEQARMLNEL